MALISFLFTTIEAKCSLLSLSMAHLGKTLSSSLAILKITMLTRVTICRISKKTKNYDWRIYLHQPTEQPIQQSKSPHNKSWESNCVNENTLNSCSLFHVLEFGYSMFHLRTHRIIDDRMEKYGSLFVFISK